MVNIKVGIFETEKKMQKHVCPVWVGYMLASPLRAITQHPEKIVHAYIKSGDSVLDFGSAMGFFSLPMAKMVGPHGKVICVDIQQKMLDRVRARALKADVLSRIQLKNGGVESLVEFASTIDFALAFAVVHEVPDEGALLYALYHSLKSGGCLLIAEPRGHVSQKQFAHLVITAKNMGFAVTDNPVVSRSWAVLLQK